MPGRPISENKRDPLRTSPVGSSVDSTADLRVRLAQGGILPAVAVIHALSGLFLMHLYAHHMTTDTPSYISIARHYAEGRLHDAVNWVWSPLLSWLLVPFLYLGVDPIAALHLLALAAGIAGLIGCEGIFRELVIEEPARTIMLLSLVPVIHAFSIVNPNPDFLVAVVLLFYVRFAIARDYARRPRDGAFCGLLGALAYFAKAYAFPFFVLHFSLVSACRYYGERDSIRRTNVRRSFFLGLAAFLLVSSVWIGILYVKYDRLTIGAVGAYNLRLVHDGSGLSYLSGGLAEPPAPSALSAWEDPAQLAEGRLKPLDPSRVLSDTMPRMGMNALKAVDAYQAGSVFSMAILACVSIGLIGMSARATIGNVKFLLLLTILLLPAGYLPLLVDRRYLYLGILLIHALGGSLVFGWQGQTPRKKTISLLVLCLSFILVPMRDLRANVHSNREVHELASVLAVQGVQGRLASNGLYDRSLFLAHFVAEGRGGTTFLGVTPPGASVNELDAALQRHRIDYYLCWDGYPCRLNPGYPAIVSVGPGGLRACRTR